MTRVGQPGESLEVDVAGRGPAILLLHGFTGTAATWRVVTAAWGGRRRVIAPDLLGHGRSDAPADPDRYALERQAHDLAAALDALEAAPADVIGYSMGARLALWLALEHGDHVRSLVLESPSPGFAEAAARSRRRAADEDLAEQLEREGLAPFVATWEAQPLFASQASLPEQEQVRIRAERLGHDPRGLAASLRGAGQGVMSPLHDRLPAIACPTLVIAGALDAVGLERARLTASAIPDARLTVIGGAGHAPHLERPDAFLRAAGSFLALAPEATTSRYP